MTPDATPTTQRCVFCAIADRRAEASVVHDDETAVAFMDLCPVTPGHLVVVPRKHSAGLGDLDTATGAHIWSVGHRLARALRRSDLRPDGINVLVCDGEAALQTVFHFHPHVIPRYLGDGWTLGTESPPARERALLDADAQTIREALAAMT
ncbi:HIT family protein [Nocardioides hankookensis]|uniref:HIT family protein n=1 Tax=Nocardioides hankookensis TaxID=443157 RepID=A0ABW1LFB3_9ACTN